MRQLCVVACLVLASACGGGGGSGNSPASPTSLIAALTIVGPHVVPAGSSASYSATATSSTGAQITNPRPTTWSTDNTNVATIVSAVPAGLP